MRSSTTTTVCIYILRIVDSAWCSIGFPRENHTYFVWISLMRLCVTYRSGQHWEEWVSTCFMCNLSCEPRMTTFCVLFVEGHLETFWELQKSFWKNQNLAAVIIPDEDYKNASNTHHLEATQKKSARWGLSKRLYKKNSAKDRKRSTISIGFFSPSLAELFTCSVSRWTLNAG